MDQFNQLNHSLPSTALRRAMLYSLIDLMNLAATRLILGSGYSSYSEVAAHLGGTRGEALPILMAGRDFGAIVERRRSTMLRFEPGPENTDLAGLPLMAGTSSQLGMPHIQQLWPRPF